jgi:hypothetical protein
VVGSGHEIQKRGGRRAARLRLVGVSSPIEETYWTAKEWALRTRFPYRTILGAVSRGELAAVRPSGTAHGVILISESSWGAWIARTRLGVRMPERIEASLGQRGRRNLSDLALS